MPNNVVITIVIVLVIALFAVLVIRGYLKKMNSGCCGTAGEQVKRVKVKDRDKSHYPYVVRLDVDGMVCGNCGARIENELNALEGVWATADVGAKLVTVRMKQPLEDNVLRNTVNSIGGYTVMSISR